MKVSADFYEPSPRVYRGLDDLTYPFHDTTMTVTSCGRICFYGRKVNLSHALARQNVGVTHVGDRMWRVSFMQYDLGAASNRSRIPSARKRYLSLGLNCYPCVRNEPPSDERSERNGAADEAAAQ
jgi:hypothetical protein